MPTIRTASTICGRCSCSKRRRVDVYLDEPTSRAMHARFGYCFMTPPGSEYPPIVTEKRLVAGKPVTIEGQGGPIERPAGPAGPRRHPFAGLPLRQRRLFGRHQEPAGRKRRGAGRPRRLDRRRAAPNAASEPFQSRRGAGLDRPGQAEARDPDQPAHRSGLRDALRRAAAARRAGLRRDVVCAVKAPWPPVRAWSWKARVLSIGSALDPAMDPTMDHLALVL